MGDRGESLPLKADKYLCEPGEQRAGQLATKLLSNKYLYLLLPHDVSLYQYIHTYIYIYKVHYKIVGFLLFVYSLYVESSENPKTKFICYMSGGSGARTPAQLNSECCPLLIMLQTKRKPNTPTHLNSVNV